MYSECFFPVSVFSFSYPCLSKFRFYFSMKLNLSHLVLDTSTGMQLKQQSHRVTLWTNRHFQQSSELSPHYVRHVLRPQSCSTERSVLLEASYSVLLASKGRSPSVLPNQCLRPVPPTPGITGPYNTRRPEWNAWHRAVQ